MKRITEILWSVSTLFLILNLVGCSSNNTSCTEEGEKYVCSDTIAEIHISGIVSDIEGNPLSGVMITSGGDTTATSESGVYALEKSRSVNGRCVVKFEKLGYFSVVRTSEVDDEATQLDAVMVSQEQRDSICEVIRFKADKGTTINVGGMIVSFPANSISYDNGDEFNGSVFASVYYLNPNAENFTSQMPGGDMGGIDAKGNSVILLSYGMVEVTLKDSSDRKLQIRKGCEATLTFPVPANFTEEQLYEQIPLWHFDEEKGIWTEEGMAKRDGNVYIGSVKHFSWVNLDYPESRATIQGYVKNDKGQPMPHIRVTVSQTYGYTNRDGFYSVYVPKDETVTVTVRPEDYAGYKGAKKYKVRGMSAGKVYTQNITLPYFPAIHGQVSDIEGKCLSFMPVKVGKMIVYTNYDGRYSAYINDEKQTIVTIPSDECPGFKCPKYTFNGKNDVATGKSYDFVIPKYLNGVGHIMTEDGLRLDKDLLVTVDVDGHRYKTATYCGNRYYIKCKKGSKKISMWVDEQDYMGGSNMVSGEIPADAAALRFSDIKLGSGIVVSGCVNNTCGPSKAKVTIVCNESKRKTEYSLNTSSGYFKTILPISKLNAEKILRIECCDQKFTKKIESAEKKIDLGEIDICTGGELEPNCIYVQIENNTAKFDVSKGIFTEMMQYVAPVVRSVSSSKEKYQVWCKSDNYGGTLVLDIERIYNKANFMEKASMKAYLIADDLRLFETKTVKLKDDAEKFTYKFGEYLDKDELFYIYGSATVSPKKARENVSNDYVPKSVMNQTEVLLIGESGNDRFIRYVIPTTAVKPVEKSLKDKGFKEKNSFMDGGETISAIYVSDNAQALVSRVEEQSSIALITREGIGSEPLYSCWKADYAPSASSNGKKKIEYMWKNEAEIAHLIMFGQLMGMKFERTNISEEKCGCSNTGGIPTVAN